MRKLVERIIARIKNEPYSLPLSLTLGSLSSILMQRGMELLRGVRYRVRIKNCGLIFCGKKAKISHTKCIESIGSGLILGDYSRINALCENGVSLGRNVTIGPNTIIECTGVIRSLGDCLTVGNNVAFGAYNYIGVRGAVTIGSDTIIGPYVSMHSENHIFAEPNKLIRLQGETRQGIEIGANCWFGAKVTVLDGVKIGEGCVIAAGTVVSKDIPDRSLVAGVPAKVIRKI